MQIQATTEKCIESLGSLPREHQERQITVVYRGLEIPLRIESARGEVAKKLAAEVKSQAIASEGLKQMTWESPLFDAVPAGARKVDDKLLRKFTAARVAAEEMLKSEDKLTLQDANRILNYKKELLIQQDSSFDIELALLSHMTAEGGKQALQRRVVASMPSEEQYKSLEDVTAALEALKCSELSKLLGPSAVGAISTCLEVLNGLSRGITPNVLALTDNGYQTQWLDRLKYFLRVEYKDESGKKKVVRREAAKRHLVQTRLAENYEVKSLQDLNQLQSFKYMLDDEEKKLLKSKTDEFLQERQGHTKSTSAGSTPANKRERAPTASMAKVKKQKVSVDAAADEKDAVRQLFA
eukprot:2034670-Amphidinium_carterae.2